MTKNIDKEVILKKLSNLRSYAFTASYLSIVGRIDDILSLLKEPEPEMESVLDGPVPPWFVDFIRSCKTFGPECSISLWNRLAHETKRPEKTKNKEPEPEMETGTNAEELKNKQNNNNTDTWIYEYIERKKNRLAQKALKLGQENAKIRDENESLRITVESQHQANKNLYAILGEAFHNDYKELKETAEEAFNAGIDVVVEYLQTNPVKINSSTFHGLFEDHSKNIEEIKRLKK